MSHYYAQLKGGRSKLLEMDLTMDWTSMRHLAFPNRRQMLLGLTVLCTRVEHGGAVVQPTIQPPNGIIVAGPAGGHLDQWAGLLSTTIGRGLAGNMALHRQYIGGLDGVTGANQFEARSEPDGSTALLVPGSAALSWLVGQSRVKFDPAHWIPLWAGSGSAVLVSRVPLLIGRTLRIRGTSPAGPVLPFLLALELIGIKAVLVGEEGAEAALLQIGSDLSAALSAAAEGGFQAVMTLGSIGPEGQVSRDTGLPTVTTAFELASQHQDAALVGALRATSLASQLDAGLVLPPLTPAASVSMWRRACAPLTQDADVITAARSRGIRLVSAETAVLYFSRIAGDPNVLLALRNWLAIRYDWRAD